MGVFTKLKEGIADLTELQVQTMTGEITTAIKSDKPGHVLDWQKLLKAAKAQTDGTISLAAATNQKFDGDTDIFVAETASDRALKAHADAVNSAREVRQGLIEMFSDLLGIE